MIPFALPHFGLGILRLAFLPQLYKAWTLTPPRPDAV